MLHETSNYKIQLQSLKDYRDKIAFLKNKYEEKDCFLLAPGPSLGHVKESLLKARLEDNLVFCVKQAFLKYSDYTDFHFINDCNLPSPQGYSYSIEKEPIIVASSGYYEPFAAQRSGTLQKWDIFCRVLTPGVYPEATMGYVLENLNFSKGLFDKTCLRPCGPSITVETVIYMAVHIGVKNIYAIGWDSGATTGKHFYDNKHLHLAGDNKEWDQRLIRNGSGPLYNWLKEQGITLHLISDVSALSDEIPRIKLEDL